MSEFRFPDPSEREKRAKLLEMLDAGRVMVYLDPRCPGVDLPAHLRGQVAVPLNLSHRFGLQTFDIGPLAVKASLSFGGDRYLCVLPYRAVFGLYGHEDGTRVIFADDVPAEVALAEGVAEADADRQSSASSPPEAAPSDAVDAVSSEAVPESDAPRSPTLRLIE